MSPPGQITIPAYMAKVYGQAMTSSKREANGKVVEIVLKPVKASAEKP